MIYPGLSAKITLSKNSRRRFIMAEIYLAGGCFWGAEKIPGVRPRCPRDTQVGYANGMTEKPHIRGCLP